MNKKHMDIIAETLRQRYGNHTRAARMVGVSPRHYRAIRNGHLKPSWSLWKVLQLVENGRYLPESSLLVRK